MTRLHLGVIALAAALCASPALGTAAPPPVQLPGAPPFDPALQARLHDAWAAEAGHLKPNTTHLNPDGSPQ